MPVLYLTEQGSTLRKDGNRLIVSKDGQVLQEFPTIKVEQVIVFGNVNLTTPVIHYLFHEGIDCVFCSSYGRYHGRLFSTESKFGLLRQIQLQAAAEPAIRLSITREIARGKLLNQRTLLLRHLRETGRIELKSAAEGIQQCLDNLDKSNEVAILRGLEGYASNLYYGAFKELLKQDMGFVSRARRPPTDPVNSLLSFGYTLLVYGVQAAVHIVGLDPFIGFFHATKYSRPSLVLDLMEEFRAIVVDSVVLRVINTHAITIKDFEPPQESRRGVFLTQEGIKKFIHHYEERVQTEVTHPLDKVKVSYRRCFELQARHLERTILGKEPRYQPFLIK